MHLEQACKHGVPHTLPLLQEGMVPIQLWDKAKFDETPFENWLNK